jgi:hypothetical protein
MQFSAQQGTRLHRPRASWFNPLPSAHSGRIVSQSCRIGAFRDVKGIGLSSLAPGARVALSRSARSPSGQDKRWQVAAGPPAFPEPDAGATVGLKETQPSPADGSPDSLASNGVKPSNGAVPANGAVSPATAAVAPAVEPGGVAHRWKIVLMMAMAFVLCNMDKVGN